MTETLTFDQLPQAVASLTQEIGEIKKLLIEKSNLQSAEITEQLLTVEQAAQFLNLSVPTIYSKVSRGELPVMKRTKRLYFSSTQLMEYLKQGCRLSNDEIEAKAEAYCAKKKKGLSRYE